MTGQLTYGTILCHVDNNKRKHTVLDDPHLNLLHYERHRLLVYAADRVRDSVLDSCKVADIVVPVLSHDADGRLLYVYIRIALVRFLLSR